jgi:ketosteroid isomerase-like protein
MKNLVYSILFLVSSNLVFAQKPLKENNAIELIKNVLSNQQQAWNDGHLEDFMNGYWENDSLVFIGKKGVTYGWQKTLDNYKKSYPDIASMGELQFDIVSIKLLSKTDAFVIGKWHLKRHENKGDLQGHFTLLFKKSNNKWVIVVDHSS